MIEKKMGDGATCTMMCTRTEVDVDKPRQRGERDHKIEEWGNGFVGRVCKNEAGSTPCVKRDKLRGQSKEGGGVGVQV